MNDKFRLQAPPKNALAEMEAAVLRCVPKKEFWDEDDTGATYRAAKAAAEVLAKQWASDLLSFDDRKARATEASRVGHYLALFATEISEAIRCRDIVLPWDQRNP